MSSSEKSAFSAPSKIIGFILFASIAVPIFSLLFKIIFMTVYTIDLPYWDDWNEFIKGTAGSFELKNLFKSSNDTLYPVGKILDNLFILYLKSNVISYKLLSSSITLIAILYIQYTLLKTTISKNYILAASLLSLVFIAQPNSYWRGQFVAYHQIIPVVCVLTILLCVLKPRALWRDIALFALTIVAGFSYVSGAFASMALAFVFLMRLGIVDKVLRSNLLRTGCIVGSASLLAVIMQLQVILVHQNGRTHRPGCSLGVAF